MGLFLASERPAVLYEIAPERLNHHFHTFAQPLGLTRNSGSLRSKEDSTFARLTAARLDERGILFANEQTVRLSPGAINRYKNHLGKAVVFAIRPLHIDRAGDGGTAIISSRIDLVQPTGARTYVTFAIGQEPVMAELDAHDAGKPGDEIKLAFDLDHFILIEPESGNVLGNGS